jgi:putative DNA primase/helicase
LAFPNGRVLDKPGYDAESCLLYDPCGVSFSEVPTNPTRDDALRAYETMLAPFEHYEFEDDGAGGVSRAVVLSALMSAILRPTMPTAPAHGFSSPTYGTGKSKLSEAISIVATGAIAPAISQNQTPEEFEKGLITNMLSGRTIINIDNADRTVEGVKLAQAISSEELAVRICTRRRNNRPLSGAWCCRVAA